MSEYVHFLSLCLQISDLNQYYSLHLTQKIMKHNLKSMLNFYSLKLNYLFFVCGFIALCLTSCSKEDSVDVNQDKIWTEYNVYYNQNDDKTHVIARFRFGNPTGTLLELVDSTGANVTFNGQKMPYSLIWNAHHLEFAGNITTGTFVYTNTDGKVFTNTIPTGIDSIEFPNDFDTIVKSKAETFSWVGSALSANQSVGMYIGTYAWDKSALFYTNATGTSTLVMGVQAKTNLPIGPGTVYLQRQVENKTIAGTSKGGVISYTYRPFDKTIEITE